MFRRAFTLVLLGILIMGVVTIAYGTFFDKGFVASAAGVVGAGDDDDDDDDDDEYDDDRRGHHHDEDHDHD